MVDAPRIELRNNCIQSLDAKNRTCLSSEFYEAFVALSEQYPPFVPDKPGTLSVMVTVSKDRNLAVFPVGIYDRIMEALSSLPNNKLAKRLRTNMTGTSLRSVLDQQKRFKLPASQANVRFRSFTSEQLANDDPAGDEEQSARRKADGSKANREDGNKQAPTIKIGLWGRSTYIDIVSMDQYLEETRNGYKPVEEFEELVAQVDTLNKLA